MFPLIQHWNHNIHTNTGLWQLKKAMASPSLIWKNICLMTKHWTAGTAVLSKQKPISVDETIPGHPDATSVKGRIVTLEFETCYLVGTYVVNAGQNLKVCPCRKIAALVSVNNSVDSGREENVERALLCLFAWSRPKEACYLGWRS